MPIVHRLSTVHHAEQIGNESGGVVEKDTHEQLLEKNVYYAKL